MSKPVAQPSVPCRESASTPPAYAPLLRPIYRSLFPALFALSSPYYAFRMWRRGNWQTGFAQRFGHYDVEIQNPLDGRPVLWVHAVSVG
ncbi:MAG TPA: hypothetical protein VHI52_01470, partial [Verrucomicrobiae bacterium]|nr:hypothetical protein [Verrucomicrobiae bacterium]